MKSPQFLYLKKLSVAWCLTIAFGFSSCYSYRIGTYAQTGSEVQKTKPVTSNIFFWGLIKSPKEITAPLCDSLQVNGMAEVTMTTNFGYALITVATLGIWSPIKVTYKCGKPCKKIGDL